MMMMMMMMILKYGSLLTIAAHPQIALLVNLSLDHHQLLQMQEVV